jgi:hypothetical protein
MNKEEASGVEMEEASHHEHKKKKRTGKSHKKRERAENSEKELKSGPNNEDADHSDIIKGEKEGNNSSGDSESVMDKRKKRLEHHITLPDMEGTNSKRWLEIQKWNKDKV